jgi:NAD(P)-dependent dehydrogenase (short-subunit alcohol dehydrogenase family)
MSSSILITGATGYIGGAVVDRLLAHPDRSSFSISAIVRDTDKAKRFKSDYGVHAIVSSLDDTNVLTDAASQADVVINAADADNAGATKAILAGLKARYERTGKAPILIHTVGAACTVSSIFAFAHRIRQSGTAIIADGTEGQYANHKTYHDSNVEEMESIPAGSPHRAIDLLVVNAGEEGYVKSYLIVPSTIYGIAKHSIAQAGLANKQSIQIPLLIKAALQRGRAGHVGEGKNIWPNVSLEDGENLDLQSTI